MSAVQQQQHAMMQQQLSYPSHPDPKPMMDTIFSCSFPEASPEYHLNIESINDDEFLISVGCRRGTLDWWREHYFPGRRAEVEDANGADKDYYKSEMLLIDTQEAMFERVIGCFQQLRKLKGGSDE